MKLNTYTNRVKRNPKLDLKKQKTNKKQWIKLQLGL